MQLQRFSAVQLGTPDAARCEMSPATESRGGAPLVMLLVRHDHTVTVECADTSELLAAVERKIRVPREATWLCFAGKKLEAGMPLTHYGLSAGSTVHLAMRGRSVHPSSRRPRLFPTATPAPLAPPKPPVLLRS